MTDKKTLRAIAISCLSALLIIFFIPFDTVGRVLAAFVMSFAAVVFYLFVKKRSILSMNKNQVLLIISIISLSVMMFYYLLGLRFGFYKNPYALKVNLLFSHLIPAAVVIVATEIIRYIVRAQRDKKGDVICYFSSVLAEMLVCSTAHVAISSFNNFMDLFALTMLPALVSNLLYHYITLRYGYLPNIVYRSVTTLYVYLIPVVPRVSDSLVSFVTLLIPLAIFLFVDLLYERRRRYALKKKSKLTVPITVLAVSAMMLIVMVVSNQFFIGAYVIATPSMTGELNVGDAAIYERYDDQIIVEGQVIVFEKNDLVTVHRVEEIENVNGVKRYYTKGDANEGRDAGFIYDSHIIGLVNYKIPYIGYPTLWLRSLFKR